MANLAASGVTKIAEYYGNGPSGKRYVTRELQLVLSTMGSATNNIPASVLGFTKIIGTSSLILSDNTIILVATPSYDGSLLLLKAAGTNAPADFSGTYRLTVWGKTR